mmetsp:Transcript_11403/g.40460  ORF Transcript_11403/g.40460 Transcript_11403/m.40460 type:complete len:95 (+) Transcript_11403:3-287(+)
MIIANIGIASCWCEPMWANGDGHGDHACLSNNHRAGIGRLVTASCCSGASIHHQPQRLQVAIGEPRWVNGMVGAAAGPSQQAHSPSLEGCRLLH